MQQDYRNADASAAVRHDHFGFFAMRDRVMFVRQDAMTPPRREAQGARRGTFHVVVCLCLALVSVSISAAEDLGKPSWLQEATAPRFTSRRDNGQMMRLVEPLAQQIGRSTVQVLCGGKPVALGIVVASDGYVLTKRSELSGDPIRVRLADQRLLPARVAAVRRESDLALLFVEKAGELEPVRFHEEEPTIASFLISVGRGGKPVGLGVLGVASRPIKHVGRLGVVLHDDSQGRALVQAVWTASGADEAGILPGDRIVAVDGRDAPGKDSVMGVLRGHFPGESVRLTIVRDSETVELDAQIRDFSLMQESENDMRVNGARSRRLSGFEDVFQHDTVLEPDQCGGPLLDTQGRVVGMNIARAGRVVSYAIPSSLINRHLTGLLSEAREAAAE